MKVIKVKRINMDTFGDDHFDFERWQKENPKVKIKDIKIIEETHINKRFMVTYEEE